MDALFEHRDGELPSVNWRLACLRTAARIDGTKAMAARTAGLAMRFQSGGRTGTMPNFGGDDGLMAAASEKLTEEGFCCSHRNGQCHRG